MATILEDANFKNVTEDLTHQEVDAYFENLRYYDGDNVSEMVFSSLVVIALEKGMSKKDKDKYIKLLVNALPENTVKMIQDELVKKGNNENRWEKLRKFLANIDKEECAVEPIPTIIKDQPEASSSKSNEPTEETEIASTANIRTPAVKQGKIPSMKQPKSEGGTSKTEGQIGASASISNEHKKEVKKPSEPTTKKSEISKLAYQGEDDPTKEKDLLSSERKHLTKTDKKKGNLSESQERDKTESAATSTTGEQILYPVEIEKFDGQFPNENCFLKPELNEIFKTLMPENAVASFKKEYVTSFSRVRETLKRHLDEKINFDIAECTEDIKMKDAFVSSIYCPRNKSVTNERYCYHYIDDWVNKLICSKFMNSEEFIDLLMLKIPYKYLLYLEINYIINKNEREFFTNELRNIEQIDDTNWNEPKVDDLGEKSITQRAVLQSKYILEYPTLLFNARSILDFSQDYTDSFTIRVTINTSINISHKRLLYFVFMDKETKFSQDKCQSLESFIREWSQLQSTFQFMKLWDFLEVLLDKLTLHDLEACNGLINYTNLKKNGILKINPKYANKFSKDYVFQGFNYLNSLKNSSMSKEMFVKEYENRCCVKCYDFQDFQNE